MTGGVERVVGGRFKRYLGGRIYQDWVSVWVVARLVRNKKESVDNSYFILLWMIFIYMATLRKGMDLVRKE